MGAARLVSGRIRFDVDSVRDGPPDIRRSPFAASMFAAATNNRHSALTFMVDIPMCHVRYV
eukprot:365154-Chlamydomonas_euryale.AAC.18